MTPLPPDIGALCDELYCLRGSAERDRLQLYDNALHALGYRHDWQPDGWIVHPVPLEQIAVEVWGVRAVAARFSAHELAALVREFPALGRALGATVESG